MLICESSVKLLGGPLAYMVYLKHNQCKPTIDLQSSMIVKLTSPFQHTILSPLFES